MMAATAFSLAVAISFLLVVISSGQDSSRTTLCPPQCVCLGNTVLCSKKELTEIPPDLPEWTETLDVSSNQIQSIPPGVLTGLLRLREINVNNNILSSLPSVALQRLPSLDTIKCAYNVLTEIPHVSTESNITHLILHHNEISRINLTLLEAMPYLRVLDLNYNKITHLNSDSFPFLPNLHQLFLNNNRIQRIEPNALDNLTGLEWLKLKKNRIEVLPKDLFKHLQKLFHLELSRNRIRTLEGLGFEGLKSLVYLKLKRNAIAALQDGAFYGLDKIQDLQLDHNNISTITQGWLYGLNSLQQLSLSHNHITHVEAGSWESCPHLWQLVLVHNDMASIHQSTFKGLSSLHYLFMNHNKVSFIEDGALKEMPALQVLEMSHNEISWTIEDTNGVFDGLVSLSRLSLDSNRIKSIARNTFAGLQQLKQLHLVDNTITSIQSNAFEPMKDLEELRFNSSSLLCDCQLSWLAAWLKETGFDQSIKAECAHPENLRGLNVLDVQPDAFKCNDYPKPVLRRDPESQVALRDSNATLVCEAVSTDPSTLEVVWKKDGQVLEDSRAHRAASVLAGPLTQVRSTLLLERVVDADAGVYQCVVSNAIGSAYSTKAKVTVHVFPVFTKTPEDVTVRAGTRARLECAATGEPAPEIAWQKDGGDDFPAARERRMHVMPQDHVFFIMEVKSEDQGIYSCTASNAAGTRVANATLNVLETPSFVKPMEDKVTRAGESTVLECLAAGSPRPQLTWFKDRQQLTLTQRHFLTADDQLLVIVQTQPNDAGLYTCVMSNTLGTERGVSEVKVINGAPSTGPTHRKDDSTTTGIIIIAVVCCVVGTSLVWVVIIYHTRKRAEEYSSTPTDDTTLPPAEGTAADKDPAYSRYSALDLNGGFSNRMRAAAIFPSDVADDDHRQQIPLTMDEQQIAEASDNSLTLMHAGRSSSETSSLRSSQSSGHLHTFRPLYASLPPTTNDPRLSDPKESLGREASSSSPSLHHHHHHHHHQLHHPQLCVCTFSTHQVGTCHCASNCKVHISNMGDHPIEAGPPPSSPSNSQSQPSSHSQTANHLPASIPCLPSVSTGTDSPSSRQQHCLPNRTMNC